MTVRMGSANALGQWAGEGGTWTAQPEQHGIPPRGLLNCTVSLLAALGESTGNGPGVISTRLF